jgi:2'-hydroxyisoflavone reductase
VGGATLAAVADGAEPAATQPLRVLILGGTGFIGPHFVTALRAHGHELTLFNRGRGSSQTPKGVEQLVGDRAGQLDRLKGRDWDVVIDDSGYTPRQVKLTSELLHGHVQHYIFVSSISAYADFKSPGIDENYRLAELKDPSVEVVSGDTYGGLKVLCEQVVTQVFGNHCAIVRPTYIAGPGDPTDRFTYWPVRVSRGGEMLVPGSPRDSVQFIDVRDLADFMRLCAERRISGVYNACNAPRSVTMGTLVEACKGATKADTRFTWASTKSLQAEGIQGDDLLEGNLFPIWTPADGPEGGAALINSTKAVQKGLRFRALEQTVRDTYEWHKQRPAPQQLLRAGITQAKEAELLAKLRAG